MTEHRPGHAWWLPDYIGVLGCVALPAIPTVYALYHSEDGVTAWVFALPGGDAIIVPLDEGGETGGAGLILTTLDLAATRWAALDHADLVLVAA